MQMHKSTIYRKQFVRLSQIFVVVVLLAIIVLHYGCTSFIWFDYSVYMN